MGTVCHVDSGVGRVGVVAKGSEKDSFLTAVAATTQTASSRGSPGRALWAPW